MVRETAKNLVSDAVSKGDRFGFKGIEPSPGRHTSRSRTPCRGEMFRRFQDRGGSSRTSSTIGVFTSRPPFLTVDKLPPSSPQVRGRGTRPEAPCGREIVLHLHKKPGKWRSSAVFMRDSSSRPTAWGQRAEPQIPAVSTENNSVVASARAGVPRCCLEGRGGANDFHRGIPTS